MPGVREGICRAAQPPLLLALLPAARLSETQGRSGRGRSGAGCLLSGAQGRAWDYVQLADATDAEGARWVVLSVSDPEDPFMLVRRTPGSAQALCVDCRLPADVRQALQDHLGATR